MAKVAPQAPSDSTRPVYTMYKSVEDEIIYMCYCAAISHATYEECMAEVIVEMQDTFRNADYNWKYWKEEESVFRKLFGISKVFPGKEPVIITDPTVASAKSKTVVEPQDIDWSSVFDISDDDEGELTSASTTVHESSESSGDDEDEPPASPILHTIPVQAIAVEPQTTPAAPVQAPQAPAAPATVSRPILTPEQRELRDKETKAARRNAEKDYEAREQAKLDADAKRARNIGAPLLPLKNGFPQYSVIATFRTPNPRNSFAGHDNHLMRKAQVYFKVLLRHGVFHGQFVAWVEPKKACQIENPTFLRLCEEAVEFLEFWESRQSMMTRNVELRDHFNAWKPWHKGTQSSIYRINLDGSDQPAVPNAPVAEAPVQKIPQSTKPRPKGPVDLEEIDTTGETERLRMEARSKRVKKSKPRKKKNKDKVAGPPRDGSVDIPSVDGTNGMDADASSSAEGLVVAVESAVARGGSKSQELPPLQKASEAQPTEKLLFCSPAQPISRKRARDDDYIPLFHDEDGHETRKRPRFDDRDYYRPQSCYDDQRGSRQNGYSRHRNDSQGHGGYSSRREVYG